VALSFPAAERVVYSTCSVHAEENERVVAAVMPAARELGYELAAAIPSWPRRGWEGEGLEREDAAKVVRADPAEDDCEGFFVALFSRPTRVRELERAEEEEREEARRKGGTLSPGGARKRPREEGGKASRGDDVRAVKFAAKKKRGKRPGGPLFR
jgi:putative methyltransferase